MKQIVDQTVLDRERGYIRRLALISFAVGVSLAVAVSLLLFLF